MHLQDQCACVLDSAEAKPHRGAKFPFWKTSVVKLSDLEFVDATVSPEIALHDGRIVRKLALMCLCVSVVPTPAILFIHPGNHAKCAGWAHVQALDQFRSLHRDRDPRSVVDRAGPQIPGIEVP